MKLARVLWKHTLLIAMCAVLCLSCKPSSSKVSESVDPTGDLADLVYNPVREDGSIDSSFLPIITWQDTIFDFGMINEGDVVKKEFSFQNTGTAPLLIAQASSTCGCTIPEWPKKPIPPGQSGIILVKFDSKGKEGAQNKQVTIFANTFPNQSKIAVKGIVEKLK
jgi:hypothetical protein